MRLKYIRNVALSLFVCSFLFSITSNKSSFEQTYLKGLWSRISQASCRDMLCFIRLYPKENQSVQFEALLKKNWGDLDTKQIIKNLLSALIDPPSLENKADFCWPEETLVQIENLAKTKLLDKSAYVYVDTLDELARLDSSKWDISQVAWLSSSYPSKECLDKERLRQYYAHIDLLALCALYAIEQEPESQRKLPEVQIEKLNRIIFEEQGFEFPPLLDHQDKIDLYTSVPSMLSSKKGVCLGVSVLYLAISQRLGLELEIVTPPGHIYLTKTLENGFKRNIETTASGMNLPEEFYRPFQSCRLVHRQKRELPGLVLMNTASVMLKNEKFSEALAIYQQALKFLHSDTSFFVQELALLCQWLSGKSGSVNQAKKLWKSYQKLDKKEIISWDSLLLEEISKGIIGKEPVRLMFAAEKSDNPSSDVKKLAQLEEFCALYPNSKWLKTQVALTAWGLGQSSRAFFVWPYGSSLSASFLWTGAQLGIEVGQLDIALSCMKELERQLSDCDKKPLTPYRITRVSLCQRAIFNEN